VNCLTEVVAPSLLEHFSPQFYFSVFSASFR